MQRNDSLSAEKPNILGTGVRAYFNSLVLLQQPAFALYALSEPYTV